MRHGPRWSWPTSTTGLARYSKRHRAREWVLRALYAREMDPEAAEPLDVLLEADPPREIDRVFARRLYDVACRDTSRYDGLIESKLENWDISRLALLDLLLLRMALAEFEHFPDVPERVTINEVIELAKRYSGAQAGSFVNGILDALKPGVTAGNPPGKTPPDAGSRNA